MKKVLTFAPAIVLTAVILFSGCSKFHDHFPPPPTDSARLCRIESILIDTRGLIYGDTSAPVPTTYRYNASNDPILTTSAFGLVFYRYDKKGKLTDVISHPTRTAGPNGWSKYSYPASDLILDSVFQGPSDISDPNPPTNPGTFIFVDKLNLDTAGRVIRTERDFAPSQYNNPPTITTYAYDANGNLIWPSNNFGGHIHYDNKICPYRTSKVWQLLYLNYSRNNAYEDFDPTLGPVAYNAEGLPTQFKGEESVAPFTGYFTTMDITYSCDVPTPTHH